MLDEIPYEPDRPLPALSRRAVAKGIAGLLTFSTLTAASGYGIWALWESLVVPFLDHAPVIEINYGSISLLGVFVACFGFLLIVSVVWVGYFAGWTRRRIERFQKQVGPPVTFTGVGLMAAAWLVIGPALSSNLIAGDYLRCATLDSDIGINYYRRVYVKHPFLCVDEERLDEQLAVYDKLAQAQREGRLSEALAQEGLAINRRGHIVAASGEER